MDEIMLKKIIIIIFLTGCASAPPPPMCAKSPELVRINPKWINDVVDYSIPWDREQDILREKLETIKELRQRGEDFKVTVQHNKKASKNNKTKKQPKNNNKIKNNEVISEKKTSTTASLKKKKKADDKASIEQPLPQEENRKSSVNSIKNNNSEPDKNLTELTASNNTDKNQPTILKTEKMKGKSQSSQDQNSKSQSKSKENEDEMPSPTGNWSIQVASYKDKLLAEQFIKRLKDKNIPAYIQEIELNNGLFHRIMVGPSLTWEKAGLFQIKITDIFGIADPILRQNNDSSN